MIKKIVEEEVKKIITGESHNTSNTISAKLKIVILNRGWVAIGKFKNNETCVLSMMQVS